MNSEFEFHTFADGTRIEWVKNSVSDGIVISLSEYQYLKEFTDVVGKDFVTKRFVIIPPPGALAIQVGGSHYKNCIIQPVEYCEANRLGACESAIVKYITRWRDKGGLEDLNKIKHYVDLLIETEQKYHGWNKDSNTWMEKE